MIALRLSSPGDRARADLDKLRAEIADVRGQIEALEDLPLPVGETVERILTDLRQRGELAENSLTSYARPAGPVLSNVPRSQRDVLAMLFNLAPDFVEKGVRAHLKQACRDGISMADRRKRAAELRSKLEALLERDEEIVIDLLRRDIVVERTPPADGDAIRRMLAVWDRAAV